MGRRRGGGGAGWSGGGGEARGGGTVGAVGVAARREAGKPGVFAGDAESAASGVRVSRGITSHGVALNVDPDLDYVSHIIPCGLSDVAVTSMARVLGRSPGMESVLAKVSEAFGRAFDLRMEEGSGQQAEALAAAPASR